MSNHVQVCRITSRAGDPDHLLDPLLSAHYFTGWVKKTLRHTCTRIVSKVLFLAMKGILVPCTLHPYMHRMSVEEE